VAAAVAADATAVAAALGGFLDETIIYFATATQQVFLATSILVPMVDKGNDIDKNDENTSLT